MILSHLEFSDNYTRQKKIELKTPKFTNDIAVSKEVVLYVHCGAFFGYSVFHVLV